MKAAFRETLWFKRGEFVESPEGEESAVPLPIEDRYTDESTLYVGDSLRFGLHCGVTSELPLNLDFATDVVSIDATDFHTLARELKQSRTRNVAAVCASVFAVAIILIGVL